MQSIRKSATVAIAALIMISIVAACSSSEDSPSGATGDGGDITTLGTSEHGYSATISWTDEGIPHIVADNINNVAFGQGWASAQDRICDLADQVLKVRSERARWFGPGDDDANIDSDFAWKAIGIRELSEQDWENASTQLIEQFNAYATGWNGYLAETGVDGINGWCQGEPWVQPIEGIDVYSYARSVTLLASSAALAQYIPSAQPPTATSDDEQAAAQLDGPILDAAVASNAWAIGSDRSESGHGMLIANPHFPWEGQLRFWENHITIPGELDMYGVQLSGLPGMAIGFTEDMAWTHTVSEGDRFTAYTLDLVEGSPTTYVYGDTTREMTSQDHEIEVLVDGELTTESRTLWHSHYGPIIDFPGLGWGDNIVITFRDANLKNDEFVEQYSRVAQAQTLDDIIELNEQYQGIPLFNTIATSRDGRAWYADTSATPKLSDAAEAAYLDRLDSDLFTQIAEDNGVVLLDGSNPVFEWVDIEGARDPGLVPFNEMPQLERSDYVFNANNSYWMSHATEFIEGDYALLHGRQATERSARTRENAYILQDVSAEGPAGEDAKFSLDELSEVSIANTSFMARELLDDVVARCTDADPVELTELAAGDAAEPLLAATVDVGPACAVLSEWGGAYEIDQAGPPLWREFLQGFRRDELSHVESIWLNPFDADQPLSTPNGLFEAPSEGQDPVLTALGRAVQVLGVAGYEPGVALGDLQVAVRNGVRIPIHGGTGSEGITNVVDGGSNRDILDPELFGTNWKAFRPGSALRQPFPDTDADATSPSANDNDNAGDDGDVEPLDEPYYPITYGTSFLLAIEFSDGPPNARAFLTYSNTEDRSSANYLQATQRFSEKRWRTLRFTAEDVAENTTKTVEVLG